MLQCIIALTIYISDSICIYIITLFSWVNSFDSTKVSYAEQENITLQYQQFIREEAKEHRLFLEDSFNKLVLLISAGTFLFGAVLSWMNYKTRSEISRAVGDRFNKQINTLLGKHLQELQLELETKNNDFEKRIATADRLIMELSGRLSKLQIKNIDDNISSSNRFSSQTARTHKVLWVDDKPRNNDSIIEMFSGRDVIFDKVTSTEDALLKLTKEDYSMIISDMKRGNSPDEGLKLLRIKSEQFPLIPMVIYSSSKSLAGYWQEAKNEGAELVTTKITELLGYIQTWLDKS